MREGVVNFFGFVYHGAMRKFGIEIETCSPLSSSELKRLIEQAGVLCVDHTHTHRGNSSTHWMLKHDGSLSAGGGYRGIEVVSPPLDFDDPDQRVQVNTVASVLRDAGCQPNDSTGIHVHIEGVNQDGSMLTARQIAAVACFFYKFEDAIYRIASSGWERIRRGASEYAKPIPESVAKALGRVRDGDDLRKVWAGLDPRTGQRLQGTYSLDRYFAVNLHSYWLRNTIEFRCFNGSVNGDRMQAYIALCMAIVEDARHGHFRYAGKSFPLGGMHSGCANPDAVMLRLQQVLRSTGRDTHVLMEAVDWKNLRKTCWRDSLPQQPINVRSY